MSRLRLWLLALLLGMAAAVLPAATASAHAAILGTDPASGAIAGDSPRQISVRFSERITLTTRSVAVISPDGVDVAQGSVKHSDNGSVLIQPLRPDLRHGTYVASFRIISADGHPVGGGFSFSVVEPSKPAAAAPGGGAKVAGTVQAAVWVGRYLGYAGAALLAGAVVIGLALRRVERRRAGSAAVMPLILAGGVAAFCGTVLSFVCQVPYDYGGSLGDVTGSQLSDTADSVVGRAFLARLVLLMLLVGWLKCGYRPNFAAGATRWRDSVTALLTAGTIVTWPFAGHAATSRLWQLSVLSDGLHVAAALVWLGGLVVLGAWLLARRRAATLGPVLDVWSRWALWAAALLAFTGVTQALLRLNRVGDLWHSHYGRLLLLKAIGLGLAVAVAAGSRRWVRRWRLDRSRAAAWLRRTVIAEVVVLAAVLVVTVVLVGTSPPQKTATGTPAFYSATVSQDNMVVQIEIDPARVGNNSVHLTAFTPSGAPLKVLEWTVTTALPARSIDPVTVPLLPIAANHVIGEAALSLPGVWRISVTVRTSDIDETTIVRSFTVT